MFSQTIYLPQLVNQNFNMLFAGYNAYVQNMLQNNNWKENFNMKSWISYAVSMDLKRFQTQYCNNNIENQTLTIQNPPSVFEQKTSNQTHNSDEQNQQKDLKVNKVDKSVQKTIQSTDEQDKIQKFDKQSIQDKISHFNESVLKCSFEQTDSIEIKRKNKKQRKCQKLTKIPEIDLIDHAYIQKDRLTLQQIEKRKNNLLSRVVQNWNETQKNRRNQKLQLRRIKY